MKAKFSIFIKMAVTVLLFYFLFRKIDFHDFGAALTQARLGLLLSSFTLLWVAHYICTLRWRMLMRPLMPVFPLWRLFQIYCIGLFFNLAFPTAVGGDVVKMYYAGKLSRLYAQSFAATFLDRDSGMLAMMIIACIGTFMLPIGFSNLPILLIVWPSFAAFVVINIAIFMPSLHGLLTRLLQRIHLGRVAAKVDAISSVFQVMAEHPWVLFNSLLISLVNQLLVSAITWVAAEGLHIHVPFFYFLVFVPVITLVTMLPISLSGMGLREYAFLTLFRSIGIAPALSLALALLSSVMIILSAIPGGIVYLLFRNRSDLQQMAAMEKDF